MNAIMEEYELPEARWRELDDAGFTVIRSSTTAEEIATLRAAYDSAVANAAPDDIKVGSTTTRVRDFVNRSPEFDALYLSPPVLKACCRMFNQPFRLSTMHARTVRPGVPAQKLHVDFESDRLGWTMAGFIYMVDEFRADNGATRFLPGSHRCSEVPPELATLACGPAGSMIVFNGSVWHGHAANRSGQSRRSIQGAYIRRNAESGEDLPSRMLPETLSRLSPLARYLLAI